MKNFLSSFGGGGTSGLTPKLLAFTLAEVLNTLGIIGVVAALTMPSLVANYQKKVWVAQLKKDVNFVLNTFQKVFADEGVDRISNTSLYHGMFEMSMARFQATSLRKYIEAYDLNEDSNFYKFATEQAGASTNSWDPSIFLMLKDGSCIAFSSGDVNYGPVSLYLSTITLDVNCDKGPNKAGRDRFLFYVNDYGKIYVPSGYTCWAANNEQKEDALNELASSLNITREELDELLKNEDLSSTDLECFYLILKDGWEMNY